MFFYANQFIIILAIDVESTARHTYYLSTHQFITDKPIDKVFKFMQ